MNGEGKGWMGRGRGGWGVEMNERKGWECRGGWREGG